ncbi:ABC transporter permease [Leptothoe kymatousa]|uniref:ABC transporter permease n=1 Tax=Leptothoe kymatousa TAU-MAC 1615 TaxID=2364775 RepID=A0ABS5Y2G6_9CYAN|nr:ABC transporter permease [Leptothoe kymatousa]MBT9312022.1 hypothetical protein [Leptothoe kymatousa TAU-MAC 1615]
MLGTNLFTTLAAHHLDRLGDRNPQLLRELKGRLKRFPVVTAIVLSLLCQIVMMIGFWAALPGPVRLDDMELSTYPRLEWHGKTYLNSEPLQDLLPQDMVNRDRAATSGVVVSRIHDTIPVMGDERLGANALKAIQQGDRLVKIDGQLIMPSESELNGTGWKQKVEDLARTVDGRLVPNYYDPLTPERQKLINTTIELELHNPERGYYSVTVPRVAVARQYSSYCVLVNSFHGESCAVSQDKQSYQLNWSRWYSDIYTGLSALIIFPLMGLGVFMLANNLAQEKRRGTLNFLQLSPRSAFTILSGKLLGVPVCLYLAIGLLFPLHWMIGFNAGYTVGHLLGFDLTLMGQTLIFYLATLLIGLSISQPMVLGLMPWLLAAGVMGFNWIMIFYVGSGEFARNTEAHVLLWSVLFSPFSSLAYFNFAQAAVKSNVNLVFGDFRLNFVEYVALALVHGMGWCALLGHGLERRFSNADMTLLKRRFSYPLTLVFAVLMVGLTGTRVSNADVPFHLVLIGFFSLVYCIALMVALSPARQTLKDWTRFRHAKPAHERLSLPTDLVLGETSSPVVAIALNLLLLTSLVVIAFVGIYPHFLPTTLEALMFFGCILMFVGSILFSTLVSQTFLMFPRKKNWMWLSAVGSISCLTFPSISMIMVIVVHAPSPAHTHLLGLPAPVAILALPLSLLSTLTMILGVVHTRQLMRSGRSESQQLLSQA